MLYSVMHSLTSSKGSTNSLVRDEWWTLWVLSYMKTSFRYNKCPFVDWVCVDNNRNYAYHWTEVHITHKTKIDGLLSFSGRIHIKIYILLNCPLFVRNYTFHIWRWPCNVCMVMCHARWILFNSMYIVYIQLKIELKYYKRLILSGWFILSGHQIQLVDLENYHVQTVLN